MHSLGLLSRMRRLLTLTAAMLAVLGALDAGSIALTKLSVPDDVRRAGQLAAAAAHGKPTIRQTAVEAFEAAQVEAARRDVVVRTEDFTLYPDGRVTLTVTKTAPTLLLDRVHALRHLALVETTATVERLPYS